MADDSRNRDRCKFNRNRSGRNRHSPRNDFSESSSSSKPFKGRPRNLRGKDIGMFYANRQRLRKQENDKGRPLGTIVLSDCRKSQIRKLLRYISQSMFKDSRSQTKRMSDDDNIIYSDIEDSEFKTEFLKIVSGTIEDKLNDPTLCRNLDRNASLDSKYYDDLHEKVQNSILYNQLLKVRLKLPSYSQRDEIMKLVNENQVVVISGETGCGKTTQVAQFILDEFILAKKGSLCKVVCTQPRRISAISVAERVAQERGETCGTCSVGYHIRLERKLPRSTGSIVFCTTGVLLKQMETDPYLSGISHLILDEIHERDVISDFIITLLKQIIARRSDLKLILMSATLNAEQFCKYYNNCRSINIPGFTYPVKSYYLEDVLSRVNFNFPPYREVNNWRKHLKHEKAKRQVKQQFTDFIEPYVRNMRAKKKYSSRVCDNLLSPYSEEINIELIRDLIAEICSKEQDDGAILVFLPGYTDICKLNSELLKTNRFPPSNYLIIVLHSKMPSIQQRKVFDKPPKGVRKIVIATNIAETSITIDDVVFVIDCGKIKMKSYDVENNIESLKPEWVSMANANQRKGRAGRVQPGVCFHLFSRPREMCLESYQKPEIQRSSLENIILTIKILQLGKAEHFLNQLMDPPLPKAIDNARSLLKHMNALDSQERLTPLGYHLARLPVNPRMGKMILLGTIFSCLDPVLSIAASLDFKDAFQIPLNKQTEVDEKKRELLSGWKSDHLVLAEALHRYEKAKLQNNERRFCWEYFLSTYTLELLTNMKDQFAQYLCDMNFLTDSNVKNAKWNQNSSNLSLVKAIVCASLYPNVAIIRKINRTNRKKITTIENETVQIHLGSVNAKENVFESPLLVYHQKLKSSAIFLHDTTMIHPLPLVFFGDEINIERDDHTTIISLSDMLRFKCSEETALLIKELRKQLDNLLKYKISHPGVIDWMAETTEVAILRAIMELITSEDMGEMELEDDEDTSYCSENDT